MKTIIKLAFSLLFILSCIYNPYAQTTWVNALPTAYHGSFAGSAGSLRLATNNTLVKTPNSWVNQNYISADHFISKIHSGVSMQLRYSNLRALDSDFKSNLLEAVLSFAPKFSFKGKYTLSPSIQLKGGRKLDQYTLFNVIYPPDTSLVDVEQKFYLNYLSCRIGLMFNTRKFFAGANYLVLEDVY